MPDIGYVDRPSAGSLQQDVPRDTSARLRRGVLLAVVAAAAVAGFLVTSPEAAALAVAQSGADLTRLLRAMAGIKAAAAVGLVLVTYWRLGTPTGRARFLVYALACGAMAVGPGLIWGMAHLKLGALLLHGGLFIAVVALWLDPGMGVRLQAEMTSRRDRLRA